MASGRKSDYKIKQGLPGQIYSGAAREPAAALLGIDRSTLYARMRKYDIAREPKCQNKPVTGLKDVLKSHR